MPHPALAQWSKLLSNVVTMPMPTISAEPGTATSQPRHIQASARAPNYFDSAGVAGRYARVRPRYHAEFARRLSSFAGVDRFAKILDVGCGTGHSSIALAEIAEQVIAIDPSPSMLGEALPKSNVGYKVGSAEHLQFAAGEFDLIAAGSSLHWFDQERFTPNAKGCWHKVDCWRSTTITSRHICWAVR